MEAAGHSCLNTWKLNRYNESTILLSKPGKCTAHNAKFPITHDQVRRLTNLFIKWDRRAPFIDNGNSSFVITVHFELLSAQLFPK